VLAFDLKYWVGSVGTPLFHVHVAGATHAAKVRFVLSEHVPDRDHSPMDDAAIPPRIAGSHALATVL
jgi:hypothetical protein